MREAKEERKELLSRQAAVTGGAVALLGGVLVVVCVVEGPTGAGVRQFVISWCVGWCALALVAPFALHRRRPSLFLLGGPLAWTNGLAVLVSVWVSWWLLLGFFGSWLAASGTQTLFWALRYRSAIDAAWAERSE